MFSFLTRTARVFLQIVFALALGATLTSLGAALGGLAGSVVGWLVFVSMFIAWLEGGY